MQSVTVNNVILDPSVSFSHYDPGTGQNKSYDATGEAANSHFGITAALNKFRVLYEKSSVQAVRCFFSYRNDNFIFVPAIFARIFVWLWSELDIFSK